MLHQHDVPFEEPFSFCRTERSLHPTSAPTKLTKALHVFASPLNEKGSQLTLKSFQNSDSQYV